MARIKVLAIGKEVGVTQPKYETRVSAGFDLPSRIDCTIESGGWVLIPTGLYVEDLADDEELQVRSRSGLALKKGIFVLNAPGTVDADYEYPNEIGVILANFSKDSFEVKVGDRIAQGVFNKVFHAENLEKKDCERESGFGHTGI